MTSPNDATFRSDEAILEWIEGREKIFGWQRSDLAQYLSWDALNKMLGDDMPENLTQESWEEDDIAKPIELIKTYLRFAWGKANDCRGISASRSIEHFEAWAWLHSDELYNGLTEIGYEYYGKPQLVFLSEQVDFDWKGEDSGLWGNDEENQVSRDKLDW